MKRILGSVVAFALLAAACSTASAVPPTEPDASVAPTVSATETPSPSGTISPTVAPSPTSEPAPEVWIDIYPTADFDTLPNPLNVLILGSDGRTYDPKRCNFGGRADVIHLVSINTDTGEGTILNFPRDSWVYVPPKGGYGRINEGLYYNGAEGMVVTVERLTGIPIHYSAITSFCTLIQLVDAVGGITVRIPYDISEPSVGFGCVWSDSPGGTQRCSREDIPEGTSIEGQCSPLRILRAGTRHLNGCDALQFARVRHVVPGGDFGRTTNQAAVLLGGLKRFRELAVTPQGLLTLLRIVKEHVRFSESCVNITAIVECRDFIRLALFARTVQPAEIESYTLRGSTGMAGTASVVFLSSSNYTIFRDVKTDGVINGE